MRFNFFSSFVNNFVGNSTPVRGSLSINAAIFDFCGPAGWAGSDAVPPEFAIVAATRLAADRPPWCERDDWPCICTNEHNSDTFCPVAAANRTAGDIPLGRPIPDPDELVVRFTLPGRIPGPIIAAIAGSIPPADCPMRASNVSACVCVRVRACPRWVVPPRC